MNRTNLKIVIAAFLIAAAATWLAGHLQYSRWGPEERYCWQQQMDIYNFDYTNNRPLRDTLFKLAYETSTNEANPRDVQQAARRTMITVLKESQAEQADEQVWIDKRQHLALQRQKAQSKYNLAAEILIAISAALGLLLFITNPPKPV
jgi:hypothetical protein